MELTQELYIGGLPDYYKATRYPRIADLCEEHGDGNIMKVLFLLVKDFSRNFNVVRNITDDQMLEIAAHFKRIAEQEYMKLTLEFFVQFFTEAKTGKCGKVYDRLDFQVLNDMFENYYNRFQQGVENQILSKEREIRFDESPRTNQNQLEQKILSLAGGFGMASNMIKNDIAEIDNMIKMKNESDDKKNII